jgi:hypothetical protein
MGEFFSILRQADGVNLQDHLIELRQMPFGASTVPE